MFRTTWIWNGGSGCPRDMRDASTGASTQECVWCKKDLWHSAAAIPGVQVLCDEEGREAQGLGAATSGQVVLYSPGGELLFSGGITVSRGHAGDNAGRDAVISCLTGLRADRTHCPVFGCPLQTPIELKTEGDTP